MRLWSDTFRDGGVLPAGYAFAEIDPVNRVRLAANHNPHLAWDEVPNGTESLALFCIDGDTPQDASLANRAGQTLPLASARGDFFHWSLIDIPLAMRSIAAGQFSSAVTARGKPAASGPGHLRQGLNDYTGWFAGDTQMKGNYFGYDGPCPPWNDSIRHRYVFTLFALDIPRVPVEGAFTGQQVREAIAGHILAQASLTGTYSLNPAVPA